MRIVKFSDGMYGVKKGFWLFASFLDNRMLEYINDNKIPTEVKPWHSIRDNPESLHKECKFCTLTDCAEAIYNYERLTKKIKDKDPFFLDHKDVK